MQKTTAVENGFQSFLTSLLLFCAAACTTGLFFFYQPRDLTPEGLQRYYYFVAHVANPMAATFVLLFLFAIVMAAIKEFVAQTAILYKLQNVVYIVVTVVAIVLLCLNRSI